ncbi:MAG: adenosylcobinamide-GDP ribazoletransferase [Burkholderiales bacterium]
MNGLRHFVLAIQFFTRIPVVGRLADWVGFSPSQLRASSGHLPGVGVLVGTLVAGMTALLLAYLPPSPFSPLVAAVLGTVFSVMLTGAFHEDGLADIADGLGGSYERERALVIMKDSRVGAFGTLALVLALLLKVSLLALVGSMNVHAMLLGIFVAHVLSRSWPLLIMWRMPYVGNVAGSKSKPVADQISSKSLCTALVWCALAATAMLAYASQLAPWGFALWPYIKPIVVGAVVSGLGFAYMTRSLSRRLQGFTGDGLGATQQVCELTFYVGVALSV